MLGLMPAISKKVVWHDANDECVMWCRRKKRCIRFLDTSDDCRTSAAAPVAPADSTSDVPSDVTMTSSQDNPGFPTTDIDRTAGTSPLHRQMTACDSSAHPLHWTSPVQVYPHMTSPPSASAWWRHNDVTSQPLHCFRAHIICRVVQLKWGQLTFLM